MGEIKLFGFSGSLLLAKSIANHLTVPLHQAEERDFEDGEHKIRPLTNVRGDDVYVVSSLYQDENASVNDKLVKTLFLIGALKDAGAKKLTAVLPYICYARKDRRTKQRDPVATKYMAQILESVGTDHVLTVDVHNLQAYQNSFRIPSDHLQSATLFADYFKEKFDGKDITVLSPDSGGVKRADFFRKVLAEKTAQKIPLAMTEKFRSKGQISGQALVGEVENKTIVIYDDIISGGTTMAKAANACMEKGAKSVFAAATHGLFSASANEKLNTEALQEVVISNTVEPWKLGDKIRKEKIVSLDASGILAKAIRSLHHNDSLESEYEDQLGN